MEAGILLNDTALFGEGKTGGILEMEGRMADWVET